MDGDRRARRRRKKLQHKARARYQELANSPYMLKPGDVYQIPGTRYGVKRLDGDSVAALVPIRFDKLGPEPDTVTAT